MTAEILQVLPVGVVEVPQTQFIVRCEQRQVPTGFQFLDKFVGEPSEVLAGCSTLTRSSLHFGLRTEASGRISCVFYVNVNLDPEAVSNGAVRTWNPEH